MRQSPELSRRPQRRALDEIAQEHGAKPVAMMAARHVRKIRDGKIATPAAANQRMKALRAMFSWANEAEETTVNPKYASAGHHTWTAEEIEQLNERHPIGTQARLAFDLLRYTTRRCDEAPRFGRQHVRVGRIQFRQAKNEHRRPIDIDIPLHPALAETIAATKVGNMTFLITEDGKPFTANGFGNKFKDWCRQADLPHYSAHGVRKATSAAALAEAGATPHQIMSVIGHQTFEEVERYTRATNRRRGADDAMKMLVSAGS